MKTQSQTFFTADLQTDAATLENEWHIKMGEEAAFKTAKSRGLKAATR